MKTLSAVILMHDLQQEARTARQLVKMAVKDGLLESAAAFTLDFLTINHKLNQLRKGGLHCAKQLNYSQNSPIAHIK